MGSTLPALPALKTNPKFIFFTDFDGTITQQDSNDFITDNLGFGREERKKGNADVLFGRRHFRDAFQEMLDSINAPFQQCIDVLLQNITLDEGFKEFFVWARENNVPIVILSGGMEPIIRALLENYLGKEEAETLQIVSNNVVARPGRSIDEAGGWTIVYHDDRYEVRVQRERGAVLMVAAGLGMTSRWRSGRTLRSPRARGRCCFMPVMECRTSRLQRRRICSLQRQGAVCKTASVDYGLC
jgi:2,3-diketo-5-methylthio-1-phosphopentane phosphatase